MSYITITEIDKALEAINSDILDATGCEYYSLSLRIDGFSARVEFIGIVLWDSETEQRKFDEAIQDYEPFEPYLREVLNDEIEKLAKISV